MARNRIFMQGSFFDTYMAKLDELGSTDAMKKGVNLALAKSKAYVNPEIKKAMEHLRPEVNIRREGHFVR